jgi:PAS domain S-box-containing protein
MAKATYLLRKAGELVKEKRYSDAVEVYLQATETDPSDSRAWFGLGVCLYKVDNLDVAHIALERARKMGYPRAEDALARVAAAERRRAAEGKGAKPTIAPAEAEKRAAARPTALKEPPPRPTVRAEEQKLNLDRYLRVMLIENIETDRKAIIQAVEGTIKDAAVSTVDYGVSTSQTMSSTVHHDVAVLDWDAAPDAAAGLIKILKIKRPTLFVVCLTEKWDPESAVEILEAGADYHLVKEPHFASALPLVMAQWARRDHAVVREQEAKAKEGRAGAWPESLDALGEALVLVDADLTILQANQAAMKQFKKGTDEFIGRPYSRIFYGKEEAPASCPLQHVLEHGEPASGQFRQEELEKDVRMQAWPVFTYAGKVSGAIVLLREEVGAKGVATMIRTREWLYRNLTEKANAGVAMVGSDGKLEYVNQGLCTMLDQTEPELIGQPVERLAPVQEQEALRECLGAAVDRRESAARIHLQREDGTTFAAELRVASFSTDGGTCLILTVVAAQKAEETELELWTEARKFGVILDEGVEKLECGVIILDADGCVSWANGAAARMFGRDRAALVGSQYMTLANDNLRTRVEDADRFVGAMARAHEKGEALRDYELRMTTDGGGTFTYWSTPIENGSHGVKRIEHFYPAVELVQAAALPPGEGSLPGIATALPEMLFTADAKGKITWCNPAAPATAGYAVQRLQGMSLADLATTDSRQKLEDLLRRALERNRQTQRAEVLMARDGGQRYWGELTLLFSKEGAEAGQQAVQGVLRDITDHRIAQAVRDLVAGERLV